MQDRTPDSLRRFLCVMHSVRTHSGRAGVSLRFRAAKTTTGEDLMLLSGSLHHPQTHRDTLNQHNLLLLLFFFHLTGPKRRSQSLSLSLSLLTSSLFHTHRKEKHSHTVRWPGRGSTSLNKTGLIIPSSLFLLLLLLFLPPTAIIYRSGSHCITDKHLHHFSSFSFGSAAQQECRTDRVVSTLCGGGEGVSDVKSKCQHPSGS